MPSLRRGLQHILVVPYCQLWHLSGKRQAILYDTHTLLSTVSVMDPCNTYSPNFLLGILLQCLFPNETTWTS